MARSSNHQGQAAASAAQFRTTHWSVVLDAGHSDVEQRAHALEKLCQTYWYPVYAFVRRRGQAPADAQDLTQGFFEHVLERQTFEAACPDKGRFRSFILGALKNYLNYEQRKQSAVKRGGRSSIVPIDEQEGEERFQNDLAHDTTPEKLYHRSWADALLTQTFDSLRKDYERAGKQQLFETLKAHLSGNAVQLPYKELGEILGLSAGAVTTSVYRMRKRYAELLRGQIANTVGSPEEIDDEIAFLFAALDS